jgi:hypothetical protein
LSLPRLGSRVLDLLDDMSNAGLHKFVIGEADLFRMEPDYETYAHLNINYVKLDRVPHFTEGWQSVLDALRAGKFFVSTGEVLIPDFSVAGKSSGETIDASANLAAAKVEASVEWTFPLAFAEVIMGDGHNVQRTRVDLLQTESYGRQKLSIPVNLTNQKWVRLEIWDMARNGAFTQPIFLRQAGGP